MAGRTANLIITALLLGGQALAQQAMPAATPATPPAGNSQAVANSGLLPIYGVELGVDKTWIDGASFPSKSADFPNAGTNASFQQVWEALKPAGFNFVRVGFDVYDLPASSNRAANACSWAQHNNVKLLLVLRGGQQGDYASASAAFVKALAALMKQDPYKTAYMQVAAYELEPDLNNPSSLQKISASAKALDLLTQTAKAVREGETETLKGSGIDATPLLVSASFDYDLVAAKAIAGVTMANDAYNNAYSALVQWLKPLAASSNIDLIAVNWFPGSISAGSVDKPPALLRSLANDVPGKQILFTTGFSTAFHSADEQKQYYTLTFANLGDLRASQGPSSPFVGVIYRGAMNAKPPAIPDPSLPQAVTKWDWQAKAGELAGMWTDQKKSDEMSWWLAAVQNNMGLLAAQADAFNAKALTPNGGMLALKGITAAVNSASAPNAAAAGQGQMPKSGMPGGMPPGPGMPGTMPGQAMSGQNGMGGSLIQTAENKGLTGLLDNALQKLSSMEQSSFNGMGGGYSGMPGAMNMNTFASTTPGFNAAAPCSATTPAPATAPTDPSLAMSNSTPAMAPTAAPCTPDLATNSFATPQVAPATMPVAATPAGSSAAGATAAGASPAPSASTPAASAPAATSTSTGAANPGSATAAGASPTLPAGSITLTKTDVTLQPANPSVGQTVQITANLHNQNSSGVTGVTVLASGAKNAVLAEADGVQIPANSTYAASLQWTPSQASSTPITLRVSDGTGTQMASISLDPVNVAAAAAVNVHPPNGSSGVGSSGSGAAAEKNQAPGDSSASTTVAPLGFAKIGDLIAQNLIEGAPGSILVPISDPLQVPLTDIKAVLAIDGKVVQTQSVSTLLPEQSRSIVFSNVVISQPGAHQARVGVQLLRAGKSQLGTVSESVFVQPTAASGAAIAKKNVAPVKTAQSLRSLTPTLPTGVTTAAANTPAAAASGSATAQAAQHSQLSLRTGDLSYSPAPASPGQAVNFRVVVRNSGVVPVEQGALVLSLYADGKLAAVSQPPIQFSVGANSSYQANWQAAMPAGRQVQLVASVTGGGSSSAAGTASIVLQSAAPAVAKAPAPVAKPVTAKHP